MGPLPSSGPLSLSQIMTEMDRAPGTLTNVSQNLLPEICLTGGATCSLGATFYGTSRVVLPVAPSWYTWNQGTTSITVYWYAVSGAVNYYFSGPNGSGYTSGTSWTTNGLSPGAGYTFSVYAINCKGNGSTNSVTVGTQPNPVTSVSSSASIYTISLNWSAPTGASYYYVQWYNPSLSWQTSYVYSTSYTITGLPTPGTNYQVYIYSISPYNVWSSSYYNTFATSNGFQDGLYPYTFATFTPGTAAGPTGPVISQARQGCVNGWPPTSNWTNSYINMATQGIIRWTVPASGTYKITCAGSRGGQNGWYTQGYGALMIGNFSLSQGAVIWIVVGQPGYDNTSNPNYVPGGGGGGGSFVAQSPYNTVASCIIAAGGGGGAVSSGPSNDPSGLTGTAGGNRPNYITPYQICGTGGDNGGGGGGGANGGGGGGAGFCGHGGKPASYSGYGACVGNYGGSGANGCGAGGDATCATASTTAFIAISFTNGAIGGQTAMGGGSWGGFGGGGCAEGMIMSGGGGGGYSGGGGSAYTGYGGSSYYWNCGLGGGSINRGFNQTNTAGSNNGPGYVTIERIS